MVSEVRERRRDARRETTRGEDAAEKIHASIDAAVISRGADAGARARGGRNVAGVQTSDRYRSIDRSFGTRALSGIYMCKQSERGTEEWVGSLSFRSLKYKIVSPRLTEGIVTTTRSVLDDCRRQWWRHRSCREDAGSRRRLRHEQPHHRENWGPG